MNKNNENSDPHPSTSFDKNFPPLNTPSTSQTIPGFQRVEGDNSFVNKSFKENIDMSSNNSEKNLITSF